MVIADRAIIYSDKEMTSPIGYLSRGKKVTVGNVPRNKGQVYPIVVSGKLAYIRVLDVTTEKETMDSTRLTAERFKKSTDKSYHNKIVASYYNFASKLTMSNQNGTLMNDDVLNWNGLALKGEALFKERFDFQVLINLMTAASGDESFNVIEFGFGMGLRIINQKKFLLRLEGHLLGVPFSNYELGDEFRVRSFGYTVGGGASATYLLKKNWGVEAFGGAYYTKLMGFDVPDPYKDFDASFVGVRFGIGVNYTY